jgi:hypothetical protein
MNDWAHVSDRFDVKNRRKIHRYETGYEICPTLARATHRATSHVKYDYIEINDAISEMYVWLCPWGGGSISGRDQHPMASLPDTCGIVFFGRVCGKLGMGIPGWLT